MSDLYIDQQDDETTVRTFFTGKQVFYADVNDWNIRSTDRGLHDDMVSHLQAHDDGRGDRIRLTTGDLESEATKRK